MPRVVSALVLVAIAAAGCRSGRTAAPVKATAEDRRAVWVALIQQAYVHADTKVVVLDPELMSGIDNWGERPRRIPRDAWASFVAAQMPSGFLPRDLDPGVPLKWFGRAEWQSLPDKDIVEGRWTAFHERFPGNSGSIELSAVGFSRDGRTAVVHAGFGSAGLTASYDIFVLRRTRDGWRIVHTHNIAIA